MDTKLKQLALAHNLNIGLVMPTVHRLESQGPEFQRRLAVGQAIETCLWIDALTRESFLDSAVALRLVSEFKVSLREFTEWFSHFGWAFPAHGQSIVEQLTSGKISSYRSEEADVALRLDRWLRVELAIVHIATLYQNAPFGEFQSPLIFADNTAWASLLAFSPDVSAIHAATTGTNSIWLDGHRPLFHAGFFQFCSKMEAFLDFHALLHDVGTNASLELSATIRILNGWRFSIRSPRFSERLIEMANSMDRLINQHLYLEIQPQGKRDGFVPYCRDLMARSEKELGRVTASGASI